MSKMFIYPDWPAPSNIKTLSTTRLGGISLPPYNDLNLAEHVGDDLNNVCQNRAALIKSAHLPTSPLWLTQTHSAQLIHSQEWQKGIQADAMISSINNHICTVMSADCLPILLCNSQGDTVAAIHAGWRGLVTGILEKTITKFSCNPNEILVWLGPAIGPTQFEVATNVFNAFCDHSPHANQAFKQTDATHYLADLYDLASQRLNQLGIHQIFGGGFCTVTDQQRFFSYRRDNVTGRMASMIWIEPK